jgi:hypothetical protein
MVGVQAGQRVQVLDRPPLDEFGVAPQLDVASGVTRVHDQQAQPPVGQQVAPALPLQRGVDPRALAVVVHPHQARMRLPVGHHRGQHTDDRRGQQVEM